MKRFLSAKNASPVTPAARPKVALEEIVLEDEIAAITPGLMAAVAEAADDLPTLPSFDILQERLLQASSSDAENFVRNRLRPRVIVLVGVGHEALYRAIQLVAELHAILDQAPVPRAASLRRSLGVAPHRAKPVHALINSLFGLPDKNLLGGEPRHAASNRHSKYAKAIEGAEVLGIPPWELADTLRAVGGLTALAKVARQHGPAAQRVGLEAVGARMLRADSAEADNAQDGEEVYAFAQHVTDVGEPDRCQKNGVSKGRPSAVSRMEEVKILASRDQARCLAEGTDIAVCLVDRNGMTPELFAGVRLPKRLRYDQNAALAWVRKAIATARAADAELRSVAPSKLQRGRNG